MRGKVKQLAPEWKVCWVDKHELLIDVDGLSDFDAAAKAWKKLADLGVSKDQVTAFYRYTERKGKPCA